MQPANAQTVLGNFDGARFAHAGVESRFLERGGRFLVRTDGPDGKLAEYEVRYTFGVYPLQQVLLELSGGRLQALSIAWDSRPSASGGQRWFHLYALDAIDFRDELHWTKRSQGWNYMCADCHSTDVRKGYDPASDSYATTWSEISVGCEACHGPGSAHLAWARTRDATDPAKGLTALLDERRGVSWGADPASGTVSRGHLRTQDREFEVCAPCHSRRTEIAEGHRAGDPLLDHYLPSLIEPGLYHPDGQQRAEVYVWGSFQQSRMYREGVTCSDCHEPHTQRLRANGNALCARCHDASRYDRREHHFHDPASAGGWCVSCHMPATNYMVVDPRPDHSLRVPRPDLSASLGVPNACNACHRERDPQWAADAVRRWYGHDARGFQAFAPTFQAQESGAVKTASGLAALAADTSQSPIVRASALARLAGSPDVVVAGAALRGARDPSPLVRLAAAEVAESLPPLERTAVAAPLLADPLRAVRVQAAGALAGVPLTQLTAGERGDWTAAAAEYVAAQQYAADRPEARTNLGTFYARLGRLDEAQAEFRAAVTLDRGYVPAYVNAADDLRVQVREDDALRWLEEGLAAAPRSAPLYHALGLAQARASEKDRALDSLRRAATLEPDNPRFVFVYAVALSSSGLRGDAIRALARAAARWPTNRDILLGLATLRRDAGQLDAAREAARALVAAYPDDLDARNLAAQLR
jgi:predicted CXXCH cytochrome family protein